MKKQYLVIAAVLIIALGAGVFVWQKQGKQVQEQPKQEDTAKTDISTDIDTSDWKTYRNEEYGFEVRYPGTIGVKLVFDSKNWCGTGCMVLDLLLPTNDRTWHYSVEGYVPGASIVIFSRSGYEAYSFSDGSKPRILGENNQYIYTRFPGGNDYPDDTFEFFEENPSLVDGIFQTFKVGS